MNGPTPIMLVMLRAVAGSSPNRRSSGLSVVVEFGVVIAYFRLNPCACKYAGGGAPPRNDCHNRVLRIDLFDQLVKELVGGHSADVAKPAHDTDSEHCRPR